MNDEHQSCDALISAFLSGAISTTAISDVMDRYSIYGILSHAIRRVGGNKHRFAGVAYTVKWAESRKAAAITRPQPSTWSQVRDFLVPNLGPHEGKGKVYVAGAGPLIRHAALAGGLSSTYFEKTLGFNAMVLGGAVRDAETINALSIPVAATNFVPTDTQGAYRVVDAGRDCTIENVTVITGDVIAGDDDGVVVIPRSMVRTVLTDALVVAEKEGLVKAQILSGAPLHRVIDEIGVI